MEPNTIVYDVVQKNQGSRYYRMKARDLLEGKLYVTSNDSTAPLAVVVSSAVYLPQKTDRAVQVAEGLGAVELVLKEGSFDNGEIFVHVQNAAKKNVEVQVEFVSSNVISEILVNQEEKTIQLAKGVSVVAGVKIPAPIVTALTNGNTAAYFSQMVFQAYAALPAACDVTFDQFGSRKYFRYASLSQAQNLVSFNIKITAKALYDNEFVYVNITSECDAELLIIPAAVHQMEENVDTVVPVMPNKAVFVHEIVLGINRKISIHGQTQYSGLLYTVVSDPTLIQQIFMQKLRLKIKSLYLCQLQHIKLILRFISFSLHPSNDEAHTKPTDHNTRALHNDENVRNRITNCCKQEIHCLLPSMQSPNCLFHFQAL
ncbi:Conserved_hypothetical protein [Hexamita inflata]|uniref:Alpha-2-macroglobulin bait region domain-containing protein n=1 Tax=Hexamita inflata TaxID=28002 RepID=A0ABP1KRA6_9EUKA